jgi:predicted transcriptional regulator
MVKESPEQMPSSPFSLRLKPEVKAQLDEEARIAERSASFLANKAIEVFLAARAAKRKQIEAALVDAERGEFISSEAMDRWIASWETDAELLSPQPDVFD